MRFRKNWFKESTLLDPEFAMARIAHAENLFYDGKLKESKEALDKAIRLSHFATERERAHIQVVSLILNNNPETALVEIQNHVKNYPTDALLVSRAVGGFGLFAFSAVKIKIFKEFDLWMPWGPHYGLDWWFLSMHSFALLEVFELNQARNKIELSLHLNERNGQAEHSYSHIFYESGQTQECIAFTKKWLKIIKEKLLYMDIFIGIGR